MLIIGEKGIQRQQLYVYFLIKVLNMVLSILKKKNEKKFIRMKIKLLLINNEHNK